jgi:hypothetical protein
MFCRRPSFIKHETGDGDGGGNGDDDDRSDV